MIDENNLPDPIEKLLPDVETILDERVLLTLFTSRVEEMMRDNLDLLLSSLYRLDVEENKIQNALRSASIPAAEGIASLIIERQKERIKTRKAYSSGKKRNWEVDRKNEGR
jgi:hypothetical protein